MALVDYSDSEGSDTDQPAAPPPPKIAAIKPSNTNFSIDRANPQKIRVNLSHATTSTADKNNTHDDEPARKRVRLGAAGGGFNAMLPPPKRTAEQQAAEKKKAPARKVFSLKTSGEVGFSRESDAELRALFEEEGSNGGGGTTGADDVGIPDVPKKKAVPEEGGEAEVPKSNASAVMFKPLSVARGTNKKKKTVAGVAAKAARSDTSISEPKQPVTAPQLQQASEPAPKKKLSLFAAHSDADIEPLAPDPILYTTTDPYDDGNSNGVTSSYAALANSPPSAPPAQQQQSLSSIATDLNLSAAERRQLFGRSNHSNPTNSNISNVINFNTDAEYAANEALRANGETVQHNPVRAIAPGKHSLRQLVSSAQGQKEALEESFAEGRRNKREAGSKYGW